jgi:hypothetical protein
MEGKNTNDAKSRISLLNKDQIKSDLYRLSNSRLFFNSVTGEQMNIDDGNEADMYEVVPDMEQYAQDNITQYNRQIDDDNLNNIIDIMDELFKKYEKNK